MTKESVLKIENLHFRYPDRPIFNGIDVQVPKGQFVGIIGPNGGGKTTLLKLILGTLEPDQGSVSLFGLSEYRPEGRLAYVPQTTHFDTRFPISVMELVLMGRFAHLSFWGRYSKEDKEKAQAALRAVGLQDKGHMPLSALSGGQVGRALIARALSSDPELLILDEPTANVDPEAAKEIYEIIGSLKGKTTVLMVTHELETIIDKVDRVLCVQNGVTWLAPKDVCAHFAMGLYHPKLMDGKGTPS